MPQIQILRKFFEYPFHGETMQYGDFEHSSLSRMPQSVQMQGARVLERLNNRLLSATEIGESEIQQIWANYHAWGDLGEEYQRARDYLAIDMFDAFTGRWDELTDTPVCLDTLLKYSGADSKTLKRIAPQLEPERLLPSWIDRYRLESIFARGGQATIVSAKTRHGGSFVLKVCLRGTVHAKALEREVSILTDLQSVAKRGHPFLVGGADFVEDGPYAAMVMERVTGINVEAWDEENWTEVAKLGIQLCHVLEYIHGRNVLHLDISSRNVIVEHPSENPSPVLLDFGFAWRTQHETMKADPNVNRVGFGTPGFSAPEIDLQGPVKQSDFYSLGKLLEFQLGKSSVSRGRLQSFVRSASDRVFGSHYLRRCIACATEVDPLDRYSNIDEFRKSLEFALLLRRRVLNASAVCFLFGLLLMWMVVKGGMQSPPVIPTEMRQLSWIEEIARREHLALSSIKSNELRPSLNFVRTFSAAGFLRVDIDDRLYNLSRGIEFRIDDGQWRQMVMTDEGYLSATLSDEDLMNAKQVYLQIDEHAGQFDGTLIVGPFAYDMDVARFEAEQRKELASRRVNLLTAKDWIEFYGSSGWRVTQALLDGSDLIERLDIYDLENPDVAAFSYSCEDEPANSDATFSPFNESITTKSNLRALKIDIILSDTGEEGTKLAFKPVDTSRVLRNEKLRTDSAKHFLAWGMRDDRQIDKCWALSRRLTENQIAAIARVSIGTFPDDLDTIINVSAVNGKQVDPFVHPVPTNEQLSLRVSKALAKISQNTTLYLQANFVDDSISPVLQLHKQYQRDVVLDAGKWKSKHAAFIDQKRRRGEHIVPGTAIAFVQGSDLSAEEIFPEVESKLAIQSQEFSDERRTSIALAALVRKNIESPQHLGRFGIAWYANPKLTDPEKAFIKEIAVGTSPVEFVSFFRRRESGVDQLRLSSGAGGDQYMTSQSTPVYWQVEFKDFTKSPSIQGYRPNRSVSAPGINIERIRIDQIRVDRQWVEKEHSYLPEQTTPEVWKSNSEAFDRLWASTYIEDPLSLVQMQVVNKIADSEIVDQRISEHYQLRLQKDTYPVGKQSIALARKQKRIEEINLVAKKMLVVSE